MGLLFPEMTEPQQGFAFPRSLAEKYLPVHVADFVGLAEAKRFLLALAKRPRPIALVFHGDPGRGKTAMSFALANDLGASVRYIGAQRFTTDELDRTWEAVNYYPPKGKFWEVICDEADEATERAQLQWLSKGDIAANLRPVMGGAVEPGVPLPVIWVFTCNSTARFEKRFLSRCTVLNFSMYGAAGEIAEYLETIWVRETFNLDPAPARPNFARIVKESASNVRDCLIQLDRLILEG